MSQAVTLTTTLTAAQKTKYESQFLSRFKASLLLSQFGQKSTFAHGEGKTRDWFRYHRAAIKTSALSEGLTAFGTAKGFTGMALTATLEEWGDWFSFSMLHWATSRDKHLSGAMDVVGQQAGESCEYRLWYQLMEKGGIVPLHPKAINSVGTTSPSYYCTDITLASVPSAAPTTVFRLTDATVSLNGKAINDAFNGGWLAVQYGAGYGHCSRIKDYASANLVMTLSVAAPENLQSKGNTNPTKVTIASPFRAALTATERLYTTHIQLMVGLLRKAGAEPFEDGYYVGIMAPEIETQLMGDPRWREAAYRAAFSKQEGFVPSEVLVWGGVKWYRANQVPRFVTTAKTLNAMSMTDGNVFTTLVLGKNAFGVPALEGNSTPELSLDIPQPNDNNPAVPIKTYGTASWHIAWTAVSLNANFAVACFSYV